MNEASSEKGTEEEAKKEVNTLRKIDCKKWLGKCVVVIGCLGRCSLR